MKNILITGGAGFIGSHLSLKMRELGYSVTILDNLSPQIHGKNPEETSPLFQSVMGKIRFIKGDVTNRQDWESALDGQDAVIHLAAETGTGQSMYLIEKYNRVNALGTAMMMDVLLNTSHQVKKIILASSRAVYGEGKYMDAQSQAVYPPPRSPEKMQQGIFEVLDHGGNALTPLPTDEDSMIHPSSVYGITKNYQESLVKTVANAAGIQYVVLRYQNVYGAGQSLLNPYTGILSVFSTQILKGVAVNVFEDGNPARDFIYIDDVVQATICAAESTEAANQTINIGCGRAVTILSVAQMLNEIYGKSVPVEISGNFRIGDIRHNVADIGKMKSLLRYEPNIHFEEGVKKFTEWVAQQNIFEDHFSRSLEELRRRNLLKS